MSDLEDPTMGSDAATSDLGVNAWLVEENYQEYLANPSSVSESWQAYFADGAVPGPTAQPSGGAAVATMPVAELAPPPNEADAPAPGTAATFVERANGVLSPAPPPAPQVTPPPAPPPPAPSSVAAGVEAAPLRGASARIVENMVASLSVPTATSVHPIPAKVLEINRATINAHLATAGRKVSFTHIIGYALAKAVGLVPSMNATFVEDVDGRGTPGVVRHEHLGLGIAIDVERAAGRSLLVPAIPDADALSFSEFVEAYEDRVARARSGKLTVDDFAGVTMTLTNPGTLGTTQSVPRLMRGQGAIIGVGAIDFPVEFRATDPAALAALGVGKVVTLTSTYDHRIIQGAESGLFLKYVDELLVGSRPFYEEIFTSLGVAVPPVRLTSDTSAVANADTATAAAEKQLAVNSLVDAYRTFGHRRAQTNPLPLGSRPEVPELDPATYGLSPWDLDREFLAPGVVPSGVATLRQIIGALAAAYCGTFTAEYMHIQRRAETQWFAAQLEAPAPALGADEQRHVLERLNEAELFESFLHSRYIGQKRFGLEGATTLIPFIDAVLLESAKGGTDDAVLGMSHRGRLNVLANIVGKPMDDILSDFEQSLDPYTIDGSGDMKYHKGGAGIWTGSEGHALPVSLVPNPSHLESVDAVAAGVARARIDRSAGGPSSVVNLLMHGDASFAGQGVVAESLNLSRLAAYSVGGTIHVVIDNQIGFTTPYTSARSTHYATDVAKGIEAPIIHVNGDEPEQVVRAARMAVAYRAEFDRDIVVDLVCYRTHGHNEGDDPSYTQPLMYRAIGDHAPVNETYADRLVDAGVVSRDDVSASLGAISDRLAAALERVRALPAPVVDHLATPSPEGARLPKDTAVDQYVLGSMSEQLGKSPEGFTVHPKLVRQFDQRDELLSSGEVDWATAEALAFGSIMIEGRNIRLIGQDARRGTFSHRHCVLVDYETGDEYTPLTSLAALWPDMGTFRAWDSLLSEYAALGFEYGYSVESSESLVLWEAQFGDFANGAQVVIDNYIVSAQEKWGQASSLVLLLPHGYEGQGPEHSSARIERYLAAAANDNLTIAQPTTAAQYFHLLRAQVHDRDRRPLVVVTPKYLLRARPARSRIADLASGAFREIIDDPAESLDPARVDRIVVCTGKIAFEAIDRRDARRAAVLGAPRSAIVRLEQLYPWPGEELSRIVARYEHASEIVWLQDEPANMGAWPFVYERLLSEFGATKAIRRVSRDAASSPATGSHLLHELELQQLLAEAVGDAPDA